MKIICYSLIIIALFGINRIAIADDEIKTKNMGKGWSALTRQIDPFDKSKIQITQIYKGDFTFKCGELNMEFDSYGFDGFSFSADIRYKITDSCYYSFKLNDSDITAMKAGNRIKVAGQYGKAGWESKNVSLIGFTSAYRRMCG